MRGVRFAAHPAEAGQQRPRHTSNYRQHTLGPGASSDGVPHLAPVLLAALLLAGSVQAQDETNNFTIQGTISNTSGGLDGVTLTVTNSTRGITRTTLTPFTTAGTYSRKLSGTTTTAAVGDVLTFSATRGGISIPNLSPSSHTIASGEIPSLDLDFSITPPPPSASLSYSKTRTAVSSGTLTLTATFDVPIPDPPSLSITGLSAGGANDLASTAMTAVGTNSVYSLTHTIATGDDDTFTVSLTGVLDTALNTLAAAPQNNTFTVDTAPPTVALSYSPLGPGGAAAAGPLLITATFSEGLVTTPSLTLPRTGDSLTSSPMTRVSSTVWTLNPTLQTAGGAVQDGTLTLTVAGGQDAAGNQNATATNSSLTIDTTTPTVTLTYSRGPAAVPAGTLRITASFSEDLTSGPSIAASGGATSTLNDLPSAPMAQVDPRTFVRDLTIGAGDDGVFTVSLSGAQDAAGNLSAAPSSATTFLVDTTGITVEMTFERSTAVAPAGPFRITATFGEPVRATPTISLDRPGTGNDVSAQAMEPSTVASVWGFTYTIVPDAGNSADDGTVRITVLNGLDEAGNPNQDPVPPSFEVDTAAPVPTLTYSKTATAVSSGTLRITATFEAPVENAPTLDIDRPGTGNDVASAAMAVTTTNLAYTFDYVVLPQNGATILDGRTILTVSDARDSAGNLNTTAANNEIVIDSIPPTVVLTYELDRSRTGTFEAVDPSFVASGNLRIIATVSEDIPGTPLVAIDGLGSGNDRLPFTLTRQPSQQGTSSSTEVFTGTVSLAGMPTASVFDGPVVLSVTQADDAAGNSPVVSGSTLCLDSTPPGVTFAIDRARGPLNLLPAGRAVITATFTEPLRITPTVRLDQSGTVDVPDTAMTPTSDSRVWTFAYDVREEGRPSFLDGPMRIAIGSGAEDRARNPLKSPTTTRAFIDTVSPSLRLTGPRANTIVSDRIVLAGALIDATTSTLGLSVNAGTLGTSALVLPPGLPSFRQEIPYTRPGSTLTSPVLLAVTVSDSAGNTTTPTTVALALDSDGDGLPDHVEFDTTRRRDGTGSTTALLPDDDEDGDSLSNLEEYNGGVQSTDMLESDTDDDGISDAEERRRGTDPTSGAGERPVALASGPLAPIRPQTIALDGSESRDPKQRPLAYEWTQRSGPVIVPAEPLTSTRADAVARTAVEAAGDYLFVLQVTNGVAYRSPPSTGVAVTVLDVPPIADAGPDQAATLTESRLDITLDGSSSRDENGDQVRYSWRVTGGPPGGATFLSTPGTRVARPILRVTSPGAYEAILDVTSQAFSITTGPLAATDRVRIFVQTETSTPPVARAGIDQEVLTTDTTSNVIVQLLGRDSVDPDNPTIDPLRPTLDFFWSQVDGPGTATFLPDARGGQEGQATRSVDPRVRLDVPGTYRFRLVVNEAGNASATSLPDEVSVRWVRFLAVANTPPIANAGLDRIVEDFSPDRPNVIELNGDGSTDAQEETGRLSFQWTQRLVGRGDPTPRVNLSDATSSRPVFVPPDSGEYRFQLVVTDSDGIESLPDEVAVKVRPPEFLSGPLILGALAVTATGTPVTFGAPARITRAGRPEITLVAEALGAEGTSVSYEWAQLREGSTAPPVSLTNARTPRATFTPPVAGTYRFRLVVDDGTFVDSVDVRVPVDDMRAGGNAGVTPVLAIATSVAVSAGSPTVVFLNASDSFDRDSRIAGRQAGTVTFLWRQTGGPARLTFDRTSPSPRVVLPANTLGTYTFELALDDGQDIVTEQVAVEAVTMVDEGGEGTIGVPATGTGSISNGDQGGGGGGCAMTRPGRTSPLALAWLLLIVLAPLAAPRSSRAH